MSNSRSTMYPETRPLDPLWHRPKLRAHLVSLLRNVTILKSIGDELEATHILSSEQSPKDYDASLDSPHGVYFRAIQDHGNYWLESLSLAAEASQQLLGAVKLQLNPLQRSLEGRGTEVGLVAARLGDRRKKLIRNRKWRSRKRRLVAEALRKETERYESADCEADEWRAKEIAKGIAKRKMQKMKDLAEKQSKEEKVRVQQQTEMGVVVEKLQELRSHRLAKCKKQGLFFPEEDDQFMKRVCAAVEEEERQAAAAANTSAAAAAILNAEEARKSAAVVDTISALDEVVEKGLENPSGLQKSVELDEEKLSHRDSVSDLKDGSISADTGTSRVTSKDKEIDLLTASEGLPVEFQHYYFGSSFDMETLIQVRRGWDAFIMPGGSRIPPHWVEPPPPVDAIWASCLVT